VTRDGRNGHAFDLAVGNGVTAAHRVAEPAESGTQHDRPFGAAPSRIESEFFKFSIRDLSKVFMGSSKDNGARPAVHLILFEKPFTVSSMDREGLFIDLAFGNRYTRDAFLDSGLRHGFQPRERIIRTGTPTE
jgi:hypothetical protein